MTRGAVAALLAALVAGAGVGGAVAWNVVSGEEPGAASPSEGPRAAGATSDPGTSGPDADGPGIPAGLELTDYTGPCTISEAGTVLDAVRVTCDRLDVAAEGVVLRRSHLPPVDVDGPGRSVLIEDSLVDGGDYVGAAVGYGSITLRRSEVRGAQHSVNCAGDCVVEDSLLHDQALPDGADWHNNAFLSNGGSGMVLRRNVLHCTPLDNDAGGGCSGDLTLLGDFAPVADVTIEDNVFKASPSGFCLRLGEDPGKAFGTQTTGIVVTGNVFEAGDSGMCGAFGAVTSVPADVQWTGNTWDGGDPFDLP